MRKRCSGEVGAKQASTGRPETIEAVFPKAQVQLCIVHLLRHSLKPPSTKTILGAAGKGVPAKKHGDQSHSLERMSRHESRYERQHTRSLGRLLQLGKK